MTTPWLCGDLATAVAEALEHGTLATLVGAVPVDEADREAAFALLVGRDGDAAHELTASLVPPFDPYPLGSSSAEPAQVRTTRA